MVKIIISSSSTAQTKNTFLNLIKKGIIEPENIKTCHCRYDVHTLNNNTFDFIDNFSNTYSLDRMAMGYNGAEPNDLLTCIRAAGFKPSLIPNNHILTEDLLHGHIIEFWVTK